MIFYEFVPCTHRSHEIGQHQLGLPPLQKLKYREPHKGLENHLDPKQHLWQEHFSFPGLPCHKLPQHSVQRLAEPLYQTIHLGAVDADHEQVEFQKHPPLSKKSAHKDYALVCRYFPQEAYSQEDF